MTIGGFTGGGTAGGVVLGGAGTTLDTSGIERFVDSASWTHGNHITKFGGEFNLDHGSIDLNASNNKGTLNFTSLTNFMKGVVSSYSIQEGTVPRQFTYHAFAGFIQDDWRITPRLTLNLGLRYENNSTIHEVNNLFGNVDLSNPTGIIGQGQGGLLYKFDPLAFAPRFGLAYDITGKGTTVLRTGFNVAYQNTTIQGFITPGMNAVPTGLPLTNGTTTLNQGGSINLFQLTNITPPAGTGTIQANVPFFSSALLGGATAGCSAKAPCTIGGAANTLQMPRVFNWNVGVQHALTNNLTLDVEYVGTHGQHLFDTADINAPAPGTNGSAAENLRRPFVTQFPWLGQMNVVGSFPAWSNYNGLQIVARQRVSHGLTVLATYTYSHALDTESSDLTPVRPQNALCVICEYGNSSFDLRHHVTMGINYDIPGKAGYAQMFKGWQVATTANVFSGRPFNSVDSAPTDDISGTGELQDRWNLVGTPSDFNTKFGTTQGIPCYDANITGTTSAAWTGCTSASAAPTIWQQCVNAASSEPNSPTGTAGFTTGMAMLNHLGCYAMGSSVIVPPAQGTFGNMSRYELYSVGTWEWDRSEEHTSELQSL
jgi:opacity protein-like surface antigen